MSIPLSISAEYCVPFVHAEYPSPETLNEQLRSLFLAREQEGDRYRHVEALVHAPVGLFESNFRLFDWPESCVQQLKLFCWNVLYRTIGELNGYEQELLTRLRVRADAWFHVTRKGGYFGLHNHPNASWSGVYCVSAGSETNPMPDSGVLQFPNPMPMASTYADMANARFLGKYSTGVRNFRLKPGQLILFPSWLPHTVLPFRGEGERITVAFNAQFKLEGPLPSLRQ